MGIVAGVAVTRAVCGNCRILDNKTGQLVGWKVHKSAVPKMKEDKAYCFSYQVVRDIKPGNSRNVTVTYALAVWQALQRQWPQILQRQIATKGPELQSEHRQVRILPFVACTMAKTWPEH